ncbi:hypothetical protein HDR63_02180 [bacterium]|nr:hypothetical protein [bacterium]
MAQTMDFVTAMRELGLGINATEQEIKEAYRQKMWLHYADLNAGSQQAKETVQRLNEAKHVADATFRAQKEEAARRKEAQGAEWTRQKYAQYREEKTEADEIAARRARAEAAARAAQAAEAQRIAAEELARQEYVKQQAARMAAAAAEKAAAAEAAARKAAAEKAEQERIKRSNEEFLRQEAERRAREAVENAEAQGRAQAAEMGISYEEYLARRNAEFMKEYNAARHAGQKDCEERQREVDERAAQRRARKKAMEEMSMTPTERAYKEKEEREHRATSHLTKLAKLEREAHKTYLAAQSRLVDIEFTMPRPMDYRLKIGAQKKILKLTEMRWKAAKKRLDDAEKLAKKGKLDPALEQSAWDIKMAKLNGTRINANPAPAAEPVEPAPKETVRDAATDSAHKASDPRSAAFVGDSQPIDHSTTSHASQGAAPRMETPHQAPRPDANASDPRSAAFVGDPQSVFPDDVKLKGGQKGKKTQVEKIDLNELVKRLAWCKETHKLTPEQMLNVDKIVKAVNTTKALTRVAGAGVAAMLLAGAWAYIGVMIDLLDEEIVRMIAGGCLVGAPAAIYSVINRAEKFRKSAFNRAAVFFAKVRG